MRILFSFGLCIAVIVCSSVKAQSGEDDDESPMTAFESLNSLKEVYLQKWDSEIHNSRSVLVYPVAVLQEFLLEHALRMPDGSAQKAEVVKKLPFDTGLPFALDLTNITVAPLQELAIQTFYTNRTPAMSETIHDPFYFSYKAFMAWSRVQLNTTDAADADADTTVSPFNPLLTVAAIRINSIQSATFTWIDRVEFFVPGKQAIGTDALRNVGLYDYTEFVYPRMSQCVAGALRLRVSDKADIIFVIARNTSDPRCSSSENLFKILEDKSLETINFSPNRMFVSIPPLRVSTIAWPERRLIQLGLLDPRPNRMQTSLGDHYESASLIFNPTVPADAPIPMISPDTPMFEVNRPFLVAVLQKENPVPVLVGLIQDPTAGFKCCPALGPPEIVLTILNKGRRPQWRERYRTGQSSITGGQNNGKSD